jgi:hypothetical protein
MRRQITFAGASYDRTQALIDGTVKPDGLELNWLILHRCGTNKKVPDQLRQKVQKDGMVRVSVVLNVPTKPGRALGVTQRSHRVRTLDSYI